MSRSVLKSHRIQDHGNHSNSEEQSDAIDPSVLKQARTSGVLNLWQRGLSSVPDSVWTINDVPEEAGCFSMDSGDEKWWETVDLTKLILASNHLSTIGEGLGKLTTLAVLDVNDNELVSLPDALGSLQNLKKLDVRCNKLTDLPASICQLASLHTLSADYNELTSICEEVCNLKQLVILSISNNLIENLPKNIGLLTQLTSLNVSNNGIENLPNNIGLLTQLTSLNVSNNKLTGIPADVGALVCLRVFDATNNKIVNLPDELGHLSKLEQLHLRHNQINHLPVLHTCTNLKEILVGDNDIQELTVEHLKYLSSLICLEIRDNNLDKLPDGIMLLEKLERLDLANNVIKTLPLVMGGMANLKTLVLDGNPVYYEKKAIIMKGTTEFKKHLTDVSDEVKRNLASRTSDELKNLANEESDELKNLANEKSDEKVKKSAKEVIWINPDETWPGDHVASVHDLNQTKSLDYRNKNASSLPGWIVEAALDAGVKTANLENNLFLEIPSNLSVLAATLLELNIGHNRLTRVTDNIIKCHRLHLLNLSTNQLCDLPPELSDLLELRELHISYNRFIQIPPVVYSLTNLDTLLAHDNHVTELDVQGFSKLTKLNLLDLKNNDISRIPPEFGNCIWLKTFALAGNPIRNPRPTILAKETHEILEYLRNKIVA